MQYVGTRMLNEQAKAQCAEWLYYHQARNCCLNPWSTPGARGDFWRGYKGERLQYLDACLSTAYLTGAYCRELTDRWAESMQAWHDAH